MGQCQSHLGSSYDSVLFDIGFISPRVTGARMKRTWSVCRKVDGLFAVVRTFAYMLNLLVGYVS